MRSITRTGHALNQTREVRADQCGIRTMLQVDDVGIKFEIVLEGRIELKPPGPDDRQCGVATLTPLDMVTSKLLAAGPVHAGDGHDHGVEGRAMGTHQVAGALKN